MKVSLIVSQKYTGNVKTLKIAVLLPGDTSSDDSQKQGAPSVDSDEEDYFIEYLQDHYYGYDEKDGFNFYDDYWTSEER